MKAKQAPLTCGDKVSHKGSIWNVQGESNGLVTMMRDGVRKVVRRNQVQLQTGRV